MHIGDRIATRTIRLFGSFANWLGASESNQATRDQSRCRSRPSRFPAICDAKSPRARQGTHGTRMSSSSLPSHQLVRPVSLSQSQPLHFVRQQADRFDHARMATVVPKCNCQVSGKLQVNPYRNSDGDAWLALKTVPTPGRYLLMIDADDNETVKFGTLVAAVTTIPMYTAVCDSAAGGKPAIDRHGGGVNALFGDGHVSYCAFPCLAGQSSSQNSLPHWPGRATR